MAIVSVEKLLCYSFSCFSAIKSLLSASCLAHRCVSELHLDGEQLSIIAMSGKFCLCLIYSMLMMSVQSGGAIGNLQFLQLS